MICSNHDGCTVSHDDDSACPLCVAEARIDELESALDDANEDHEGIEADRNLDDIRERGLFP